MINKEKIITGFKQFIRKAASFPLSSQFSFQPSVQHFQSTELTDRKHHLKLVPVSEDTDTSVKSDAYRLHFPQTRIFHTLFQQAHFTVQWLEYLNIHVLLIEVFENKHLTVETELGDEQAIRSLYHPVNTGHHPIRIEITGQDLLLIQPVHNDLSLENLLPNLEAWLENEHRNHPLQYITCPQQETIQTIDDLWAQISWPDRDDRSGNKAFFAEHPMDFFWLQELYIRLGRGAEWKATYWSAAKNRLSSEQASVLQKTLKRYEALDNPNTYLASAKKISPSEFMPYLVSNHPLNGKALHELQDCWDRISQPFLSLWFSKEIEKNTEEYIAFMLLAREKDFWWADQAYRLIVPLLPESTRRIIQLIWSVQSVVNYHPGRNEFTFSVEGTLSFIQEIFYPDLGWDVKFSKKQDKEFIEVKGKEGFTFRMDKNVRLSIDIENKVINIRPRLLRPPLKKPALSRTKIEIDGFTVHIPLAWGQFYIVLNENRIKFIRKKKRFQLSFRVRKDLPALKIDGREIKYATRYFKDYVPVRNVTVSHTLQLYTPAGRSLRWFSGSKDTFVVAGYAVDVHGLIQTRFNLSLPGYSRNRVIHTNGEYDRIECPTEYTRYRLKARYYPAIELEMKPNFAFIRKLINTEGIQLVRRLRVFLSPSIVQDTVSLRQKFFKYWGFYPDISSEMHDFGKDEFTFFIYSKNDHFSYTVISEFPAFKLIRTDEQTGHPALFIDREDIEEFFARGFTWSSK